MTLGCLTCDLQLVQTLALIFILVAVLAFAITVYTAKDNIWHKIFRRRKP